MKNLPVFSCLLLSALWIVFQSCSQKNTSDTTESSSKATAYYSMDDFTSVGKYDVHIHIRTPQPTLIEQAAADNFRLLDVNVDSPSSPAVEEQQKFSLQHVQAFPERVAYASTISVKNWNDAGWQDKTIAYLKDSFNKGAIAVKVWKNIGMELKDKDGKFVMIDHPRFDPVLDFIAKNKIPLLSHQGEPRNCWLPIEQMTVEGDKTYFKEHPQYHMYLHPEYPSYEDQINARDHMLEKHPDLQVVSVHLASLEWNVDEIAKRLDKYPNMAVDMAARIPHLHNQAVTDRQKVYDFFIKYQDRLLYGTDIVITENKQRTPEEVKKDIHETWLNDWKFFATDENMVNQNSQASFKGLKLPKEVVDKIYRQNAEKWIPGLAPKQVDKAAIMN